MHLYAPKIQKIGANMPLPLYEIFVSYLYCSTLLTVNERDRDKS